jgi:hypothetical protein
MAQILVVIKLLAWALQRRNCMFEAGESVHPAWKGIDAIRLAAGGWTSKTAQDSPFRDRAKEVVPLMNTLQLKSARKFNQQPILITDLHQSWI